MQPDLARACAQVVVEGGWRNRIASPLMAALRVPIMRTWNQTVPLWFQHHDYHPNNPHPDCVRAPCACYCAILLTKHLSASMRSLFALAVS
jgi:hypothetical protein